MGYFLITAYILFLRGDIQIFSETDVNPKSMMLLGVISAFCYTFWSNLKFSRLFFVTFFVFTLWAIFPMAQVFFGRDPIFISKFIFEVLLNIALLFAGYGALNALGEKLFISYHLLLGLCASIPVFVVASTLEVIRRVGAGGDADEASPNVWTPPP